MNQSAQFHIEGFPKLYIAIIHASAFFGNLNCVQRHRHGFGRFADSSVIDDHLILHITDAVRIKREIPCSFYFGV